MKEYDGWNLERVIKFNLKQNNVLHLVKEFPYVMYSVRAANGSTRWAQGVYSPELGYCIKYMGEYLKSSEYKKEYETSTLSIHDFYKSKIHLRHDYKVVTPVPLGTLDNYIIERFEEDIKFSNVHQFLNGVNSNSYNQVPDICKKYMTYKYNNWEIKWSKEMIDVMLECCKNSQYAMLSPQDYPSSSLQFVEVFTKFINLTGKTCLVLGSISPWIECLLLHFDALSVTTLDYVVPECDYKINLIKMADYKQQFKYDVIISYSSLEHDGLGRYGDPINPNGDIEACLEAHTMLKDGGYFICGLPIGSGIIEGNFHRIYNQKRLDKLFRCFKTFVGSVNYQTLNSDLNFSGWNWQNIPIFMYQK
jgi:hypothetical protein